jgi:hypothetical protein
MQGRWHQPVQQQGWVRQRAFQRGPSTIVNGQGAGATMRGVACGLPPMVERTMPTYEVGRLGDDDVAVRAAEGGIIGAEASSSKGGNTSTVLRSVTARCFTAPSVFGCCVSTSNTVVAIAVKSRAWLTASLSSADAFVANAVAHQAASTTAVS